MDTAQPGLGTEDGNPVPYIPHDEEAEKASNSYLMSLIAIMVGLPLPIINLLATLLFFLLNRGGSPFVKWHCTQALLSQLMIFGVNAFGFSWTMTILFGPRELSNEYFAYLITIFFFNLFEFVITIYTAIKVRKGHHIEWFLVGPLTNVLLNKK